MSKAESDLYGRIHDLVTVQLEEPTRDSESNELQQLVIEDPKARRLYSQYMQELFHIASRLATFSTASEYAHRLGDIALPADDAQPSLSQKKGPSSSYLFFSTAIAATLLIGAVLWFSRGASTSTSELATADKRDWQTEIANPVATIVRSREAVWQGAEQGPAELSRVAIGQEIELRSGSLELVFDSGVETLLLAPCQMTIIDSGRVSSEYGRISARVGESGKGFIIDTPVAQVTDLGTEFGIAISDSGQTEVAVFEGEVDLQFGPASQSKTRGNNTTRDRLVQGEALRIDRSGQSSRIVSIDNRRLPSVRQLPPVFYKDPIIASVQDNISDQNPTIRKFYRIVHGGLREDSQAFVDRTHQWNGIDEEGLPKFLWGADYIMPFNDDKFVEDLRVDVTLTRPATVYVFLSDNVKVPSWLSEDFVETGVRIGLDEGRNRFRPDVEIAKGPGKSIDTVFSVWKQEVLRPQRVTFGSVDGPGESAPRGQYGVVGYNMYGIAAVAL